MGSGRMPHHSARAQAAFAAHAGSSLTPAAPSRRMRAGNDGSALGLVHGGAGRRAFDLPPNLRAIFCASNFCASANASIL
eukprot:6316165-Alexandrium_andersonii.AAC.1